MQLNAQAGGANQGPMEFSNKQLEINPRIRYDSRPSIHYRTEITIHKYNTARLVPTDFNTTTTMGG